MRRKQRMVRFEIPTKFEDQGCYVTRNWMQKDGSKLKHDQEEWVSLNSTPMIDDFEIEA